MRITNPIETFDPKWEYSPEFVRALKAEAGRIQANPQGIDVQGGLAIVNSYRGTGNKLSPNYLVAEESEIGSWESFRQLVTCTMLGSMALGKG